ncbi:MAG: hypothetical protein K2X43_02880 [Hyphomonadaceae bacterium]|jgi:hypothetical protein|nr:hypothetical protein [Hyphomonadaceae bacterium]
MNHHKIAAAVLFTSVLVVLPHGDSQARMLCDGNFQAVRGQPLATPYCREQNLARVARGYGVRVSDDAIRYSESAKADVCRFIGHDLRVQEICAPYSRGGSRFRR